MRYINNDIQGDLNVVDLAPENFYMDFAFLSDLSVLGVFFLSAVLAQKEITSMSGGQQSWDHQAPCTREASSSWILPSHQTTPSNPPRY